MTLPIHNTSLITSVSRVQQNLPVPQYVLGGRNAGSYALFKKKSASYVFSNWRSKVFVIGRPFDVMEIKFVVMPEISANMTIIPVLYFDNEDTNSVGTTINNTNYTNSEKLITLRPENFNGSVHGTGNFFLELQFSGSALVAVELPISIDIDIDEN